MTEDTKLSKAEKLALTGAIAPVLRSASATTQRRRIAKVDKDGNVTGYTTLAEVQEALVADKALEIQVDEGVRPKEILCELCGKVVDVGPLGVVASICRWKDGGCRRQFSCPCGCGKRPPRDAMRRSYVERRGGRPWVCAAESARTNGALVPVDVRVANLRRGCEAMTQEQRSGAIQKANAALTPEKRSIAARAGHVTMGPERRSAAARKRWETRRNRERAIDSEVSQ